MAPKAPGSASEGDRADGKRWSADGSKDRGI